MPALEFELAGLYAAETDEKHQEQQYGLGPAANCLQNGSGGVDGGYLGVDEICTCSGDHAYHQHPVFQEFEKSAFHFGREDTFYLRFTFYLSAPKYKKRTDETYMVDDSADSAAGCVVMHG